MLARPIGPPFNYRLRMPLVGVPSPEPDPNADAIAPSRDAPDVACASKALIRPRVSSNAIDSPEATCSRRPEIRPCAGCESRCSLRT